MALDAPGLDTALARLLHEQGRVPLLTLQELLDRSRAERPEGDTLAVLLVRAGHLTVEETHDLLRAVDPQATTTASIGDSAPSAAPGVEASRSRLAAGTELGDYRLLAPLGAGGMGEVFLAEHRLTGGRYALKCLPPGSEPEDALRFRREAEAMAQVEHPHVGRIHTVGQDRGRLYLVMEALSGGDLARRLDVGPLEARQAARLVADLARGLAHVHERGIIHRDLKPQNILFDELGVPKLVDFGLARLRDADSLTQTGTILGTPAYMAPEQAQGDKGMLGPHTDVYGLGAVFYRCVTGSPPFAGGSIYALLEAVLTKPPLAPRALRPDLSPALETICLRALSKAPEDRQPSAGGLAAELEAWLAGEVPRRPGRGAQRALATVVLTSAVVAGLLFVTDLVPSESPPPVAPRDGLEDTAARPSAERISGWVEDDPVSAVELAAARLERTPEDEELQQVALAALRALIEVDPAVAATRARDLAEPLAGIALAEAALARGAAAEALDVCEGRPWRGHPALRRAHARASFQLGRPVEFECLPPADWALLRLADDLKAIPQPEGLLEVVSIDELLNGLRQLLDHAGELPTGANGRQLRQLVQRALAGYLLRTSKNLSEAIDDARPLLQEAMALAPGEGADRLRLVWANALQRASSDQYRAEIIQLLSPAPSVTDRVLSELAACLSFLAQVYRWSDRSFPESALDALVGPIEQALAAAGRLADEEVNMVTLRRQVLKQAWDVEAARALRAYSLGLESQGARLTARCRALTDRLWRLEEGHSYPLWYRLACNHLLGGRPGRALEAADQAHGGEHYMLPVRIEAVRMLKGPKPALELLEAQRPKLPTDREFPVLDALEASLAWLGDHVRYREATERTSDYRGEGSAVCFWPTRAQLEALAEGEELWRPGDPPRRHD